MESSPAQGSDSQSSEIRSRLGPGNRPFVDIHEAPEGVILKITTLVSLNLHGFYPYAFVLGTIHFEAVYGAHLHYLCIAHYNMVNLNR